MENKSEREDHDDVGDQSDGAKESTPEMKIADIDTLVSEGCVCAAMRITLVCLWHRTS